MRRTVRLALTIAVTLCVLLVPAAALAVYVGPGYTATNLVWLKNGDMVPYDCYSWSAGTDGEGTTYMACDTYIYRVSSSGAFIGAIPLESNYRARRDVAATQDGSALYYVAGAQPPRGIGQEWFVLNDPQLVNVGKVIKLVRQSNGSYRRDASFNVGPFTLIQGQNPWAARNVDVDAAGRVYITVNAYIYVYSATGAYITRFGNVVGGLEVPQGLSVAPDGNSLYVVEQKNDQVQRWYRDSGSNNWHRDTHFAIGHYGQDNQDGCTSSDYLASPYDVDTDGAGNIYVLDTSCHRILKYDYRGSFLKTIWYVFPDDQSDFLYHGFAVNWKGDVIVPEAGARYVRNSSQLSALDLRCAPDSDAPTFTSLSVPHVVYNHSAWLHVAGRDRCSHVTGVRISGSGVTSTQAWQPYHNDILAKLSGGAGAKQVQVSLRDTYGHVTTATTSITFNPLQPLPRRHIRVRGKSRYCHPNPMSELGGSWLLADSCASFSGRVVSLSTHGPTRYARIEVGTATAHRMFRNAQGPVQFWVVASRATHTPHRLRVNGLAHIDSALVLDRRGRTLSAAPTWRWTRL